MSKPIKTIQRILAQHQKDQNRDKTNKEIFFSNYAKQTDKNKKIEMLREAAREGWI